MKGKTILAATDLSDGAGAAARWARALGAALDLRVVAAHVVEVGLRSWMTSAYAILDDPEKMEAARQTVDTWFRKETSGGPDDVAIKVDDFYTAMRDMVADHGGAMIAMARSGKGTVMRTLLGSRVQQLVSRPVCPIAVVHPDAKPVARGAHVGVAIDFSPTSEAALRVAAKLASALGGTLHLAHVLYIPELPALPDLVVPASTQSMVDECMESLKQMARVHLGSPEAAKLEVVVGSPVGSLVGYAEKNDLDLLVVGHKGDRSALGDFLGSVARGLITSAPCTVLVTPEDEAAEA
jgi:nucleotide-binding universal stress UspA family protein